MALTHINPENIPDVAQAVREKREGEVTVYPVRSTYASKVGHPCLRFLVYHRTFWDLLPKPIERAGVFRRGRLIGDDIAQEARDALKAKGVAVVEQEVSIPPNPYDIGGRIDFGIMVPPAPGERPVFVPVEAKSMFSGYFDQLPEDDGEAVAWFLEHPAAYMRCYPVQLLTYMHFRKIDVGLIYVRSAQSFDDRQILVRYDSDLVDTTLDKAVEIKQRTEAITTRRNECEADAPASEKLEAVENMLPGRIDFDPGVCGKCDFQPWCVPDITQAQGVLDLMDNDDLQADCEVYHEMNEPRDAYEAANKRITAHCKAVVADEKPGATRTLLTKTFGLIVKKNPKSTTKKVLPLEDILNGGAE